MSSSSRAPAALLVLITALLVACGGDDDGGSSADAGPAPTVDAGADAGVGDGGEDLCPGQLTFEALVADAESSEPVFEVELAQVGGSNQAASAPNGRAA